jgi:hypothetical protein
VIESQVKIFFSPFCTMNGLSLNNRLFLKAGDTTTS